jgi:hypothetical protein
VFIVAALLKQGFIARAVDEAKLHNMALSKHVFVGYSTIQNNRSGAPALFANPPVHFLSIGRQSIVPQWEEQTFFMFAPVTFNYCVAVIGTLSAFLTSSGQVKLLTKVQVYQSGWRVFCPRF